MKHIKIKILIAALAAAAIGACVVGTTFATFTDKKSAENKFSLNDVTTEIVEKFEETDVETKFVKEVQVKNTGETDCLVRVRVNVNPVSDGENILIDGASYDAFLASLTEGNESGWVYNANDGFIYYMDVLKSGDTTENLMSTVDVIDLDEMSDEFNIIVYEESVQTAVYTGDTAIKYDGSFKGINDIFNAYEAQSETEPTT